MLGAPAGTLFIVNLGRVSEGQTNVVGHSVVAIRTNDGIISIPTNARTMTQQRFRTRTAPANDIDGLRLRLSLRGTRMLQIVALDVIEVRNAYHNPFEQMLSLSNCTGEGEDRRGSGALPAALWVNQCGSGARCE